MPASLRPTLEDLTVVIPTLGRPILEECLEHLARGSAWPAKILVVDQSSSPAVAELIGRVRSVGLDVEHVPSTQRGRASGVNRGLERATTRFVAVTDDDCFVDREWAANLADQLRANPEKIVTGRVDATGPEHAVAVMPVSSPAEHRRPSLKHDSLSGGNMGVARSTLERIGMLDEDPRLRTAEDCEYSYRALRAGVPIVYAPDVAVLHYGWRDFPERAAQYRSYARSMGGFYGKYLRRGDLLIAARVVVHHLRALKRWLTGIVTSDAEMVAHGRSYLFGMLPGIVAGLRRAPESGGEGAGPS